MAFEEYFERINQECLHSPQNPVLLIVRRRGADLFTFPPKTQSNPLISKYFARLDESVELLLDAQLPSGSWPDYEADLKLEVEFLARYWARPFLLSMSYANPLSRHYRSQKVLAGIETSLRRGRIFTKPGYPRWNNWWACDIGFPLHVTSALLLIDSEISPELKEGLIQDLYFRGYVPQHIGFKGDEGTGANAAWVAINSLRLAALSNNWKLALRARAIMSNHSRINQEGFGEGIMPDGSFHQHGNGLNMGYGESHLESVAQYVALTEGTELALSPEVLTDLKHFAEYCSWLSFRGTTDIFTRGRAASRDGELHDYAVSIALLQYARVKIFQDVINSFFAGRPQDLHPLESHFPEVSALHARLTTRPEIAVGETPLSGVRAFPYSGYLVSRSSKHFVSVQCTDENLKSWESIHRENTKGYYEKEGAVFFLTPACPLTLATQYQRPWDDRFGVTRVEGIHPVPEQYGQSIIVRCDVEKDVGIMAIQHRQHLPQVGNLTARKSYCSWDSYLFMMASDIIIVRDSASSRKIPPCATSLFTVPLLATNPNIIINGNALSAEDIQDLRNTPRSLSDTCSVFTGDIALRVKNTPQIETQIVHCDYDPSLINALYAPIHRPPPVDWLVIRSHHIPPDASSNYECLCAFATDEKSYENQLSMGWPDTQTGPKEHRIDLPIRSTSLVVDFRRSLFNDLQTSL